MGFQLDLKVHTAPSTLQFVEAAASEQATGFYAECPSCGARMFQYSPDGVLRFNEFGWGVHSQGHWPRCTLTRAIEAPWQKFSDLTAFQRVVRDQGFDTTELVVSVNHAYSALR